MLDLIVGLFIGFTLGWIARVLLQESNNDLELEEIARQMREDFAHEVTPNVHVESDRDRPQAPLDG